MAVRLLDSLFLLWIVLNLVTPNLVTSLPEGNESLLDRGPRESLNETGRYLYSHPFTNDGNLLCKKCSDKALEDDTYSFQQQPMCIKQNFDISDSRLTTPFCNVGEDLGCGPVPINHTNSHWVCDPGYSDKIHTVYSTCRLICNISQTIIGKIYCRETLVWYIDMMDEEKCGVDIAEKKNFLLPIMVAVGGGILLIGVILLVMWYRKKCKKPSRPSTPEIPLQKINSSSSIGYCSIQVDEDVQQPLIESNNNDNNDSKPQKVTTSTSICSHDMAGNGHSDSGLSFPGETTSTSSQRNEGMYQRQGAEAQSIRTSKDSSKSMASQPSSQRVPSSDEPTLKIFCAKQSESRLTSGLDNMRIQDNSYSTLEGSDVYFATNINVDSLKIVRKDEGPDFRGGCFLPNSSRIMVLKSVVPEDAGRYRCTVTLRGRDFHYVFSLFVGRQVSNSPTVEEDMEGATNYPRTEGAIQQSSVVQTDETYINEGPDHHGNNTDGQPRVNSERLPPEGAENDNYKVSGIPFNGARPKIPRVRINQANLFSGGSGVGNKDSPQAKSLGDSTLTNNLDKTKEESENNLNQFKSPRNISENVQNIFSLESNAENSSEGIGNRNHVPLLSDTESSNINNTNSLNGENNPPSSHSMNMEPALNVGSLLNSKDTLSWDDNPSAAIDEGTIQSSTDNKSESIEFPTNALENDLDFSDLLNSKNDSDQLNKVSGDQHNFESEAAPSTSVSHLDPGTIDRESVRPRPSGRSEEIEIVEAHSDLEQQTDVKTPYNCNMDVRGERSLDTSPIQPLAHVRLGTDVRPEQGTSHVGYGEDSSVVPCPHGDRLDEPIREMNVGGAIGGEGVVPIEGGAIGGEGVVPRFGQRAQNLTKGIYTSLKCKTLLKDLGDCACMEELCHRANPRKLYGDKKSWFGLALFYRQKKHFVCAIEHATSSEVNHGPMHYLMTNVFPQQSLTIGDIVYYFTQSGSVNKEIVDLLIDRCKDHVNCDYCEHLRRNINLDS